jgi:Cu2+-exporting ATPase
MPTAADLDEFVRHPVEGVSSMDLVVEGVHCGACVATIEKGFKAEKGVRGARVNLASKRVTVEWDDGAASPQTILTRLEALGYPAYPFATERRDSVEAAAERRLRLGLAVAFAGTALLMALPHLGHDGHRAMAAVALPTVAIAGWPFFVSAFKALRAGSVNMDVPIAAGVLLSVLASVFATMLHTQAYYDSGPMLLLFLLAGRYLDQRMRRKTREFAASVANLRPERATRLDANGEATEVGVAALKPGDLVLARAGERVPVDGTVEDGRSEIDQSLVTGESRPVPVAAGSEVYAGSVNLGGGLRIRVAKAAVGTLIDEVNVLIEKAVEQRSSYVKLADRAARWYAPLVGAASLGAFLGWLAAGGTLAASLQVAIAVLIVTCPCALGLAIPAVQVVAAGALFRRGVILNGGDALERLADIDTIVFDKTGTLTLPKPSLVNAADAAPEELALAGALALSSRHPLAAAVAAAAKAREPISGHEFPGQGVTALVNGKRLKLGSIAYCKAETEAAAVAAAYPDASLIAFRGPERALVFAATQALRPDAAETVAALKARGLALEIISGDRETAVAKAAQALGIETYAAGLKPADKIARLKALAAQGRRVLMVGDGLNDAPALAAASVSISPISAAHLTQAQADALFLGDRLAPVADAVRLGRKAKSLMVENLWLSVIYNFIAVPIAIAGLASPLIAALAMSGSSILVTTNALRARSAGARR